MKMYRIIGYIVELEDGRIVNFAKTEEQAKQFCAQHGIPNGNIRQTFVHEEPKYQTEAPKEIELYEPDANGFMIEAKETND